MQAEPVFENVIKTNTLRCGYYVFPPVTYRDPNTGELSGFSIDMMKEIGKRVSLNIEWSEEVTFGNWVSGLKAKRFDALCTPIWPEVAVGREVSFTRPFLYAGLSPLVRVDDQRFKTLEDFDKEEVTFLTQEGNAIDSLTRTAFPKAKIKVMPAMTEGAVLMQEIVTKKADAMLSDKNGEIEFSRNNPSKLKLIHPDIPVKVQSFSLGVGRNELVLRDFLDNAIQGLLNDNTIDRMMSRWEPQSGTYLRVDIPYKGPGQ